jgi:hypothetical protein
MEYAENKCLVGLWLSPSLRNQYKSFDELNQQTKQFQALNFEILDSDLYEYLWGLKRTVRSKPIDTKVKATIEKYLQNQNIVHLFTLMNDHPDWRMECLRDQGSGGSFLLIDTDPSELPLVINLRGSRQGSREDSVDRTEHLDQRDVLRFIDRKTTWLEVRGP